MISMREVHEYWPRPRASSSSFSSSLSCSPWSLKTPGILEGNSDVVAHIMLLRGIVNSTVSGPISAVATAPDQPISPSSRPRYYGTAHSTTYLYHVRHC